MHMSKLKGQGKALKKMWPYIYIKGYNKKKFNGCICQSWKDKERL